VLTAFEKDKTGEWNNHVELGIWADAMIIAPATANTIAKIAHGICDNLLLATYLSARCPVWLAPAMDLDMLQHPSTAANLERIRTFGNLMIEPGYGELASGLTGTGRMAEPEDIFDQIGFVLNKDQKLKGKKVLVTAGPTYEAIDPVRFIGNHSTGKMGFAIAEELAQQGATVTLIAGPTNQQARHSGITVRQVVSAEEMYDACTAVFEESDIAVLAAAVADYRPANAATEKIKKNGSLNLELTRTTDIAESLGKLKTTNQFVVGFALETSDEQENALKKLKAKNFDLIVLNSLNDPGAGFGHDTNKIAIFDRQHKMTTFALKDKKAVAKDIVNAIVENLHT
jgi:phosphopantothenoylcysteine decarboxylase/phosphopantothenate--cysteine ligase